MDVAIATIAPSDAGGPVVPPHLLDGVEIQRRRAARVAKTVELSAVIPEDLVLDSAGQRVVVGLASANRDERIYRDAEIFSLERASPAPHLSFGLGQHFCVGAPLARLEAEVALDLFLEHFSPGSVRLAPGFEHEWMPLPYMLGPVRIDVEAAPGTARP